MENKVMIFGTFDHLHPGHLYVFSEAGKSGKVFVVVSRDSTVKKLKKHKPDFPQEERLKAVKKAFPGATVLLGDKNDFLAPVKKIKPDLILLGYDQALPAGIKLADLPCKFKRLKAYRPEKYKSRYFYKK